LFANAIPNPQKSILLCIILAKPLIFVKLQNKCTCFGFKPDGTGCSKTPLWAKQPVHKKGPPFNN